MIIHSIDLFKPKIGRCKEIRALSRSHGQAERKETSAVAR